MKALSTFNGMGCAWLALDKVGIKVTERYSSEIDKYATIVNDANYPDTIQLGDVRGVKASDFPNGIDILLGGSPCQGFSFAGKQLAFDDPRSALFFEFVRLKDELKPKYFLLENVRMKQEFQDIISEYLGVKPIRINSNLVSGQNRDRYYWTNIPNAAQPADKGILLESIVQGEGVRVDRGKANAIIASIGRTTPREYFYKRQGQCVFVDRDKSHCLDANYYKGANWQQYVSKSRMQQVLEFIDGEYLVRKLTPIECERLQTVPDNYTNHVSNTQRYKMLGNGWTVDVIAHIFKGLKEDN